MYLLTAATNGMTARLDMYLTLVGATILLAVALLATACTTYANLPTYQCTSQCTPHNAHHTCTPQPTHCDTNCFIRPSQPMYSRCSRSLTSCVRYAPSSRVMPRASRYPSNALRSSSSNSGYTCGAGRLGGCTTNAVVDKRRHSKGLVMQHMMGFVCVCVWSLFGVGAKHTRSFSSPYRPSVQRILVITGSRLQRNMYHTQIRPITAAFKHNRVIATLVHADIECDAQICFQFTRLFIFIRHFLLVWLICHHNLHLVVMLRRYRMTALCRYRQAIACRQ